MPITRPRTQSSEWVCRKLCADVVNVIARAPANGRASEHRDVGRREAHDDLDRTEHQRGDEHQPQRHAGTPCCHERPREGADREEGRHETERLGAEPELLTGHERHGHLVVQAEGRDAERERQDEDEVATRPDVVQPLGEADAARCDVPAGTSPRRA